MMKSMFALDGQTAYVTGAASGLGFAMAEALCQSGAHVVLSDVRPQPLEQAVGELTRRGYRATGSCVDVTDATALRKSIDEAGALHGRLDILIANAGLSAGPGPNAGGGLEQIDPALWSRVIDTNLTATFNAIRFATPHMKKRRYGRVLVTASVAGMRAEPMCGYAYASSKAALINLVRQCALELSADGITVNAISPGPFRTGFGSGRLLSDDAQGFAAAVPLGRLGEPDEIKGAALLLCSGAGSFITGANLAVDGGVSSH